MLSFIPLEKSALYRSPDLGKWIEGWASILGKGVEASDPAGWYEPGNNNDGGEMNVDGVRIPRFNAGKFVWSPAPAVAIIGVEDLMQAIQTQTQSLHVLGVPRLLSSEWMRHV